MNIFDFLVLILIFMKMCHKILSILSYGGMDYDLYLAKFCILFNINYEYSFSRVGGGSFYVPFG